MTRHAAAAMLAWVLCTAQGGAATLTVRVEGIRCAQGLLRLSLFSIADGYPEESGKAARTLSVEAELPTLEARFSGLGPGPWALAVLHDENGNGRLDRNFLGIPREGIGASNGATRRLGSPKFQDARFDLPEDGLRMVVTLRYW